MQPALDAPLEALDPFDLKAPAEPTIPFVYASPHSGTAYLREFLALSRLDIRTLRRSEDAFVDELFGAAPTLGAPLLSAVVPRAFLDLNREPHELDPEMFADALPAHANTTSHRVSGGLGTIARIVSNGAEIYRTRLRYRDAGRRIDLVYMPYHRRLRALIDEARARFGCAIVVDCHSMPSIGGPFDRDSGRQRADVILGDRFGRSCAPAIMAAAERTLRELGYRVFRNNPYAGGFTTQHYGRPAEAVHALQVELNRALYMDEGRIARTPLMPRVRDDMTSLMRALADIDLALLDPPRKAAE